MAKLISKPESTVPFYEMAGSPEEKYTTEGFQAVRTFLVAWEQREAFAKDVMGNTSLFDYRSATYYPNRTSVFPIRITFTPADKNALTKKALSKLHLDLNSYDHSWAIANVEYRTISEVDLESGPENEPGTKITYRLSYESIEEEIRVDGWVWQGTTTAIPTDTLLMKRIPQALHQLVWSQVLSPPWVTIQETQGKLNRYTFLDCPPGTLLFEGVAANKLYRSTFEDGESPFCWAITYTFRQKAIHHDENTYGWNEIFRSDTGTWGLPTQNGKKLYDDADFGPLFQSV